ncbi:MAG: hypothetical protein MUP85_19200 [Candidatus Lokiarchaeota archaeon]|nr:hypothetical protein [Candidatus Lokiarchaeota archaeon]
MDTIDNLKKLFLRENWRYLILVIWLIVGIGLIQFKTTRFIGLLSFLPFLAFLMYLVIFSLIAKKDVTEVATWKVLLLFFLSLPLMLLIAVVLVIVFAFSIFSYFFLTSWFILYGAFLSSKRLDNNLKGKKHRKTFRTIGFFGGLFLSVFLSVGYILYSQEIGAYLGEHIANMIYLSNYVVFFVWIVVVIFTVFVIIFLFKKVFVAWLGVWFVFLIIYTFYLLIKIFLAFRTLTGTGTSSLLTQIIMLIGDFAIILYSVATLMGSQAELLMKRLNRKRIGIDTIVLWLVFSKVAYEFARNFPFSDLEPLIQWFPNIFLLTWLNSDWVNFIKNLLVLAFFLLTLFILGFYEFSKYFKEQKKLSTEEDLTIPQERIIPNEEETLSSGDFSDLSGEIKEVFHPKEDTEKPEEDSYENFKDDNPESEDDGNNSSF